MQYGLNRIAFAAPLALCIACSGGGASGGSSAAGVDRGTSPSGPAPGATATATAIATATPPPPAGATPTPLPTSAANAALHVPAGFSIGVIARVPSARGLTMLPNGDLLVGSDGSALTIVPNADDVGVAGAPQVFANFPDPPSYGVAYANGTVYAGSNTTVWAMPYRTGDRSAASQSAIVRVRQGPVAPHSDGDVHRSTSVAVAGSRLFVSVGSSCNACTEVDPTRATVQTTGLSGGTPVTYAKRIRNAIALAVNPASGVVWAGGAGQDALPTLHPYEFIDALSTHSAPADYGWPECEENQHAYVAGADCSHTVTPLVEFPAYSTLTGAAFYPPQQGGAYAFPAAYRGGLFVSAHGSWHTPNGHHVPPRVAFVAMNGDAPLKPANWNDPTTQWSEFIGGFQNDAASDARVGRPDGIAVGPNGSLFVADDSAGVVYRIRPH